MFRMFECVRPCLSVLVQKPKTLTIKQKKLFFLSFETQSFSRTVYVYNTSVIQKPLTRKHCNKKIY